MSSWGGKKAKTQERSGGKVGGRVTRCGRGESQQLRGRAKGRGVRVGSKGRGGGDRRLGVKEKKGGGKGEG